MTAIPSRERTDVERLTAIDAYIKILKTHADELRTKVEKQMGASNDERKGAFLADGTRLGAVTRSDGNKTTIITSEPDFLAWVKSKHPEEIVQAVNPAYRAMLLADAKKGAVGEPGHDPYDGELLDFIQVVRGAAYVTVTTTPEGKARMAALASGFAGMLESPKEDGR